MRYTMRLFTLALLLIVSLSLMAFTDGASVIMGDDPLMFQDGDDDDDDDDGDGPNGNAFGHDKENNGRGGKVNRTHPFADRLAERYDVPYDAIIEYFEMGFGLGEIQLALQTAQITGENPAVLLDLKGEGGGWGNLWKDLGLIGSEKDGGPPPWAPAKGHHKNKDKENNGNNGNGNGPPDHAGQGNDDDDDADTDDDDDDDDGNGNNNKDDDGKPGKGPKDKDDNPGNGNGGDGDDDDDDDDADSDD